jgi:hypothetical protein
MMREERIAGGKGVRAVLAGGLKADGTEDRRPCEGAAGEQATPLADAASATMAWWRDQSR